ncbi:MAG: glycosyltransferase family 39 protein [Planctomycetota bacterium]
MPQGEPAPRPERSSPRPGWLWWAVVGVTLLALGLRLFRLGQGGLWYDELIMARITDGTWVTWWTETRQGRPPIYPAMGLLWADWFGHSDAALRSLSVVFGVASVPLLFGIGRRLFDWRVGLVAAVLMAVSPYQVYYSQEYRYYAMFLAFSLAAMVLLLRALGVGDEANAGEGVGSERLGTQGEPSRRWSWLGYVVLSTLAFYTHGFALFTLASIGVAVLVLYSLGVVGMIRMKVFLGTQVVLMGLILPWGLMKMALTRQDASSAFEASGALVVPWISSPPWWAPVRTVGNFMFLGVKYLSLPWVGAGMLVLLVGLAVAVVRSGGLKRWAPDVAGALALGWRGRLGSWWMVLAWTFGPLLLVLALSYTVRPIYNDRYLIASTAGLYLFLAAGMVALSRVVPMWAMTGVIMLGMAGSLGNYYAHPEKGAWAEAAAWLDENRVDGEVLAFSSERDIGRENANVRANWFWYADSGEDQEHLEVRLRSDFTQVVENLKRVSEPHAGVWLVMWRDPDRPIGLEDSFANGAVDGLELAEVKKFFDLTLMRFEQTDGPVELADSEEGPPEPMETPGPPDLGGNKSPLITR